MICYTCGHCSMHKACPYCGAPDIRSVVGFDPIDLLNPIKFAADTYSGRTSTTPELGRVSEGPGLLGQLWDAIPNPFASDSNVPNPLGTAYDLGYRGGDVAKQTVSNLGGDLRAPFDAVSSFVSVLKWVVIGGAVVGAIVLLYGVIKFVPVALGIAGSTAHETTKMIPHLVKASL